jgi:hypothetical protein
VKNTAPYFVAKIRRDEGAEKAVDVPKSMPGTLLRPATSSDYWLVVSGNRIYRQERILDLTNLSSTAMLQLALPLKVGEKWYLSDEKE